jgi:uncharacterized repeat protein (TIGR01451 family)
MTRPKVLRPLVSVALAALFLTALPTAANAGVIAFDTAVTLTDGTATVVAGTTSVYTLTVTNLSGNAASPEVAPTFSQGIVTSWSCDVTVGTGDCGSSNTPGPVQDFTNIGANSQLTYTINLAVPSSATGTVLAEVTVADSTADDTNDSAADQDSVTRQADLSITKTDGVTAVQPGEVVTYTIVASNAGPSDEPVANVGDTLPLILQDASWTCAGSGGGTCTAAGTGSIDDFASIPAGASVTYTLIATVDPEADGSEIVANAANVQSTQQGVDPNGANDAALDVDQVADFTADLVALKTAPASAVVGGTISYTIGVRNDGPDLARDVVLEDALPAGTTFVSMTQTTGPVATVLTPAVGTGGTVEADWDVFPDGATAEFTVVVQLGETIEIGDAVVNTAAVESFDQDDIVDVVSAGDVSAAATIDPVDANNDITVTTVIVAQATTTTTTTSTTLASTTTTARVGSGTLARTGGESGGPMGTGVMIVGAGLVLVGAAELRRRRATM